MTRGKLFIVLVFLTAVGGLGWWQRGAVAVWWRVRELVQADEGTRMACAGAFKELGEDAVGPILSALKSQEGPACRNLELGLQAAVGDWPRDDPRTLRTMQAVRAAFVGLSMEGKKSALHFAAEFAGREQNASLSPGLFRLLEDLVAVGESDDDLRPAALELAGALVECGRTGQWQGTCRGLAVKGFRDKNAATRVAAIQLVFREPLCKDNELLAQVVPFLRDHEA